MTEEATNVNWFQKGIDDGVAAGPGVAPVIDMTVGDERSRSAYLRGFTAAQKHSAKVGDYHSPQEELERMFATSAERSKARRQKTDWPKAFAWLGGVAFGLIIIAVIVVNLLLTGVI